MEALTVEELQNVEWALAVVIDEGAVNPEEVRAFEDLQAKVQKELFLRHAEPKK